MQRKVFARLRSVAFCGAFSNVMFMTDFENRPLMSVGCLLSVEVLRFCGGRVPWGEVHHRLWHGECPPALSPLVRLSSLQ